MEREKYLKLTMKKGEKTASNELTNNKQDNRRRIVTFTS